MQSDTEFSDYEPIKRPRKKVDRSNDDDWINSKTPFDQSVHNRPEEFSPAAAIVDEPAEAPKKVATLVKEPLKTGHGLTYLSLFLFTAVLYFRPYELIPALSGLTSLALYLGILTLLIFIPTQLALSSSITVRPSEVNLVLLLVLLALISIPLALNHSDAWNTFNDTFIRAVLIFIVIVNAVNTERRLQGLFLLALAVACYLSIVAVNDYRSGNLAMQGIRIQGAIGGMFGNPNDLAIHLVMMFPLALGIALASRKTVVKVACVVTAVLCVAAVVVTYSRGGFLALVGAGVVLTWKFGRRQRFISVSVATLAVAAMIALSPGGYGDRVLSIVGLSPDSMGSVNARKTLLTRSIYTTLRRPWGIGMGNYHIVALREGVSHNAYTQVASELGVLAFVVYVALLIVSLKRLRRIEREAIKSKESKRFYYLAVGLQASVVGYMIGSFFASVAYQWYVYYLVGYIVCLHRIYSSTIGYEEVSEMKKGKPVAAEAVS